jgi:hypothetical protein
MVAVDLQLLRLVLMEETEVDALKITDHVNRLQLLRVKSVRAVSKGLARASKVTTRVSITS